MAKVATKKVTKTKTVRHDVAEQLRTSQELGPYLDAWLEEAPDGVSGIARALGDIARAKGMSQVVKDPKRHLRRARWRLQWARSG